MEPKVKKAKLNTEEDRVDRQLSIFKFIKSANDTEKQLKTEKQEVNSLKRKRFSPNVFSNHQNNDVSI